MANIADPDPAHDWGHWIDKTFIILPKIPILLWRHDFLPPGNVPTLNALHTAGTMHVVARRKPAKA
jgi:hypothetical protein